MTKTTWVVMLLVLISAAGLMAFSPQGGGHRFPGNQRGPGGNMRREIPLEKMAEELEITDEQLETIREIRFEHQETMIDKRAELEKAKLEMEKLMVDEDFDRDKIYSQAEKIDEIESEIKLAGIDAKLRGMEILTDEQREQLKERPFKRNKDNNLGHSSERGFPGPKK